MKSKILPLITVLVLSRIFCIPVYGYVLMSSPPLRNCTSPDSAGTIIGKSNACFGDTVIYTVPAIGFATSYNWQVTSGIKIISGTNTNTIKVVGYDSGYITVEGVNSCSTGKASSFYLTIHPLPTISIGLSPTGDKGKFCETDPDVTLNARPAGGIWTSSVSGIISGGKFKPSSVPTIDRDKWITLTYYYNNPNTKCDTAKSLHVFVQSKPTVNILAHDIDTCRSDSMKLTLTANSFFTSKINWVHDLGPSRANFDANLQLSKANPTILNLNARSDSTTYASVFVFSEAEGACPISIDTLNITIRPRPRAEVFIDDTKGCEPHVVNCNAHLINDVDSINAKYLWTFGEQPDNTTQTASHSYASSGTCNLMLNITSEFGCDTTFGPIPIDVYPVPEARFGSTPRYTAMTSYPTFKFKDSSQTNSKVLGSKILKYCWDFGDVNVDSDASPDTNPQYTYNNDTGKYVVTLFIETNHGCRDTANKQVQVIPDQPFKVAVFPNPSHAEFSIEVDKWGDYSLKLFDVNGKLVLEKNITGYVNEEINRRLAKGIYSLIVKEVNGDSIKKTILIY